MQVAKIKSVGKTVIPSGEKLDLIVGSTMQTISAVVGATLGPSGRVALLERQEVNLAPYVTKDGVSVLRSLGFTDSAKQVVFESMRDASIKTSEIAGDGTTCTTILAESFYRFTEKYLHDNPRLSPQKVVRQINEVLNKNVVPILEKITQRGDLQTEKGRKFLHAVARTSGNGDQEIADVVLKAFDESGDEGNITLTESSGDSKIDLIKVKGYPIAQGFEESCQKFWPAFLNDQGHQRVYLENCLVLLYFGKITEPQTLVHPCQEIMENFQKGGPVNVIVIATGFSEDVLGTLMVTFPMKDLLKIVPVLTPQTAMLSSQQDLLLDLSAYLGATVFDPINRPLSGYQLSDSGKPIEAFEMGRYRSTLTGDPDEMLVIDRIEQLREQTKNAESKLESALLNERIAKLSGGIVKLVIGGASNGETKEKRDRLEDSICAVRTTIKYGCLAGGGFALLKIVNDLCKVLYTPEFASVVNNIIIPALKVPVERLLSNSGLGLDEIESTMKVIQASTNSSNPCVFDSEDQQFRNPLDENKLILDSYLSVSESIKNAVSVACSLATLGGIVVFNRDDALERQEGADTLNYLKNSNQLK